MSEAVQKLNHLRTLQEEIRNLLQESEMLFAPPRTTVFAENIGEIEASILQAVGALDRGGGSIVIVKMPAIQPRDQERRWVMKIRIEIECGESTVINRSMNGNQVYAERLGEIVNTLLDDYQPVAGGWSRLTRLTWDVDGDKVKLRNVLTFETDTVYTVETVAN